MRHGRRGARAERCCITPTGPRWRRSRCALPGRGAPPQRRGSSRARGCAPVLKELVEGRRRREERAQPVTDGAARPPAAPGPAHPARPLLPSGRLPVTRGPSAPAARAGAEPRGGGRGRGRSRRRAPTWRRRGGPAGGEVPPPGAGGAGAAIFSPRGSFPPAPASAQPRGRRRPVAHTMPGLPARRLLVPGTGRAG